MANKSPSSTSVIVVGGSLVGLSTAMFLAIHGVPTVLLERHSRSSLHPRAIGYGPRTMELFRAMDIDKYIPPAPPFTQTRKARIESLAGKWYEEEPWTAAKVQKDPKIEYSPCGGAAIAQDSLEPILRSRATELGADVRMENKLLRFEQDADGVTAFVQRADGSEYTLRAPYLVAADGGWSQIRETLTIGCSGRGIVRTLRSILFRAPLDQYLEKGISQFNINQEGLEKAFMTTYRDGRWVLMFSPEQEREDGDLLAMVHKAIGRSDLDVEIITTGLWESSASIADRFLSGRIFLVGDAAHTLPPSRGGFGANTGIEDAHNLAWKLSEVVNGVSSPKLLETYDAERRPIAWLRYQQLFARMDPQSGAVKANGSETVIIDDDAIEYGQLYRSSAVLDAGEDLPPARTPDQWAGQPGSRAPHMWVSRQGESISTLDLFQRGWVLIFEDERWKSPATKESEELGIRLECIHVGTDVLVFEDKPQAFQLAFGLGSSGASLVRPDGYIAWRSSDCLWILQRRSTMLFLSCRLLRGSPRFENFFIKPQLPHNYTRPISKLKPKSLSSKTSNVSPLFVA